MYAANVDGLHIVLNQELAAQAGDWETVEELQEEWDDLQIWFHSAQHAYDDECRGGPEAN